MAIRKPRIKLVIPRIPGGYLSDPPSDCEWKIFYCPNPHKYESVPIVDYILCNRSCRESKSRACSRKQDEDKGARRRITIQRNGG